MLPKFSLVEGGGTLWKSYLNKTDESIVLMNIWKTQLAKYEKKASLESAILCDFFCNLRIVKPKQRNMEEQRYFPIITSRKLASKFVSVTMYPTPFQMWLKVFMLLHCDISTMYGPLSQSCKKTEWLLWWVNGLSRQSIQNPEHLPPTSHLLTLW